MRRFDPAAKKIRPVISSLSIFALLVTGMVAQPAQAQSSTVLANDFDYYADFTGSQVLTAGASDQVIPASGSYAIEAWINPKPYVAGGDVYKTIVSQNQVGGGRDNDRLFIALQWIPATTSPIRAARYVVHVGYGANDTAGDFNIEVGDGIPVNTWSHIGISSDGTNTSLSFNGRVVDTWAAAHGAGVTNAPFTIGATAGSSTHFFDGAIDQVKVWGGSMTAAKFSQSMHVWGATGVTSPPTLLAHYDFNDRSADQSMVFDSSDGTASGFHLDINSNLQFKDVKRVQEVTGRQEFIFPRSYLTKHDGWKVPAGATTFDALLVGGGGGGGSDGGGGGGGGEINQATNEAVTAGTYLKVQVGQGGLSGSHKDPRPDATGTAGLPGQTSAVASSAATLLSANGGAGGHAWRNNAAATRAAGGTGGTGGVRTAGATGGIGPVNCSIVGLVDADALGNQGTVGKLTGLVYGSGGGGGIEIDQNTAASTNHANTAGDGAGRGSIVEATGDATPGFSGLANRGGGGGGSSACREMVTDNDPVVEEALNRALSRADGGNGGSGLVVISIALPAKCFYESGGWVSTQDPGIKLRPLGTTGPIRRVISAAETTPFYGEVTVVNGKIYVPDRGRGQLRRMNLDGSQLESLGSLPSPGLGTTTDGRYVYATSSSGIARYDTETGIYQESFIGKGDLAYVHAEISFARFNGVGYLFIANNADNFTGERYGRIHAVPVTGTIPTQLSNTTHLFSQSKLTGEADRTIGSSGLAVLGNTVYWSEFAPSTSTARVYRKAVTFDGNGAPTNLPTHNTAVAGTPVADATVLTGAWIRSVSTDGTYIYVTRSATWLRLDPANNHASSFIYSNGMYPTANGTTPSANCSLSPGDVSASVQTDGKVSVSWTSGFGLPNAQVSYRVEYRNNGGAWVQGASAASTAPITFTPTQALSGDVEVRVATFTYGQLSEFSYAEDFSSTPPAPPALCQNPMRLEYVVPANATVTLPLTNGGVPTTVTVRWAQGVDSAPTTWSNGYRAITYTYPNAGTYEVQVCGQFTAFGASTVAHPYLTKVISWGEAATSLFSLANAFRGASILTDVPNTMPTNVNNLESTFVNAKIFNDPDIASWNVSNVTTLSQTFNGASAFNQNLGSWDVSNVTDMITAFANTTSFNNGGSDSIKNWNTSKVTNLFSTFAAAKAFNQPIGSWDVSSVTTMAGTFEGATVFNQPLNNWNTTNVTSMRGMFSYAVAFNQNIGNWDTRNVTNFASMFYSASAFNNAGSDSIKNWDTSAATTLGTMFFSTGQFNQPLATRTFSSGTIAAATTVPGDANTKEVATLTLSGTFAAGDILRVGNAANYQVVVVLAGNTGVASAIKTALDAAVGAKYDVVETSSTVLTLTAKANGNLSNLTVIDQPSAWNVSAVTDMKFMFAKTTSFNQNLTSWNVANVTDMDSMFWIARAFNNGTSSAGEWVWDTSKVTNMKQMFSNATSFKQVPKFKINALRDATNMLNSSGLTDTQYGTTIVYFRAEYDANPRRALANVPLGATDKTAFCNDPQAAVLALTAAGWTITDKTNRTAGYCTPTVTVTANNGSHVYGNPVPSVGFTYTVSGGSLPTSDWLNEIVCAPKTASNGTVLVSKQAVGSSYVTECSGPSGTGLGILVNYVDGTYAVTQRPITVQAKNRVAMAGNTRFVFGDVTTNPLENDHFMITSGTIADGDTLTFTLANSASVDGNNQYTTAGATDITIVGKAGSPTDNYDITGVAGKLTVSDRTYVFTAKSFTKVYGDAASFNSVSGYICETLAANPVSCATELGSKTVSFSSNGISRSAAVGSYPIAIEVIPGPGGGTTYQYVNSNGGVIEVVKRRLTVTPTAQTVAYGAAAPAYTFTITGFADGEGVGNLPANYAPTCTSGYSQSTPRGSVLAITCSGGNAGTNYFFEYATSNLTVPGISSVSSDVPQTIMLAEEETGTVVDFGFSLTPINEICFATLYVYIGEDDPQILRKRVTPGSPLAFELPLDLGSYDYELFVDGNCAIEATRGSFAITEYVAPTPQAQPEAPAPIVPVPYSGPIINYFSNQQIATNTPSQVVIDGDRLGMITDLFIGDTKLTFTRDANGRITITLPALPAGVYDLKVMYDGGGMLIHQQAFRVGKGTSVIEEGGPILTRTLRYTNFAGDGFRLPAAARAGITRFFSSVEDVNRVVCRGITSATVRSASDQKLAERRASEACNLARQLAPKASIELRTSPAAGVGPRFRAVNLFIVYSLD